MSTTKEELKSKKSKYQKYEIEKNHFALDYPVLIDPCFQNLLMEFHLN